MPPSKPQPLPRQHRRLVAKSIEAKKIKPGLHFDGDGLILQVSNRSSKSWILRTVVHGKRRDMGLGSFPMVSLAEAREAAELYRKIARRGGDPFAERDKVSVKVPTFRDAAEIVHKEHSKGWKNQKHATQWINTLKTYVFPILGSSPVDQIRSEHIKRVLDPIWLTKPETARRVLQRIGSVLLWAKGNGSPLDSPTDEIKAARGALPKQNDKQQHHKAIAYSDVPDFITKLRAARTSDPIKLGLEFLILTAARTGEVLGARWSEVDLTCPGSLVQS